MHTLEDAHVGDRGIGGSSSGDFNVGGIDKDDGYGINLSDQSGGNALYSRYDSYSIREIERSIGSKRLHSFAETEPFLVQQQELRLKHGLAALDYERWRVRDPKDDFCKEFKKFKDTYYDPWDYDNPCEFCGKVWPVNIVKGTSKYNNWI